jgi:hypothetical protein
MLLLAVHIILLLLVLQVLRSGAMEDVLRVVHAPRAYLHTAYILHAQQLLRHSTEGSRSYAPLPLSPAIDTNADDADDPDAADALKERRGVRFVLARSLAPHTRVTATEVAELETDYCSVPQASPARRAINA